MAAGFKTGGRKAGVANRRNDEAREKLAALGCDPLAGMAFIAQQAVATNNHELALKCFKELAKYVSPQLKAMEVTGANGRDLGESFNPLVAAAAFGKSILERKETDETES